MRGAPAAVATSILAIASCIAGCFDDKGLAIEIDVGATGATSVELYLGKAACDSKSNASGIDCMTIAPPGPTAASPGPELPGHVWFRDDDARYTAKVSGHTAAFRLTADAAAVLPIVIAVGSIGDATRAVGTTTLRDLAIPVDDARIVRATLVAAQPVAPEPDGPSDAENLNEDRVQVWTKQTPASSCVVVEHWTNGVAERDFVVPADDPDCDDVVRECNPSAYRGSEPGGVTRPASCFAEDSAACLVGSLPCSDDVGTIADGMCGALHDAICLPSQFCLCPAPGIAEPYPYTSCLQTQFVTVTPRVDCNVPALHEPGRLDPCPGDAASGSIDLDDYPGNKCKQPLLASLGLARTLTQADFATGATFSGATMELSSPRDPCSVTIRWKDGTRVALGMEDSALIAIPGEHGISLIPLALHYLPNGCAMPFHCSVVSDENDPVWSCLK